MTSNIKSERQQQQQQQLQAPQIINYLW